MIGGERSRDSSASVLHIRERDFDVGGKAVDELTDVVELAAEADARSVINQENQFHLCLGAAQGLPVGDLGEFAIHLDLEALLRDGGGSGVGLFGQDGDDRLTLPLTFSLREGEGG